MVLLLTAGVTKMYCSGMTKTCSYDEIRDEKYCWCDRDDCPDCNPVEEPVIKCDRCGSDEGNGFASETVIFSRKTLHLCRKCRGQWNADGTVR